MGNPNDRDTERNRQMGGQMDQKQKPREDRDRQQQSQESDTAGRQGGPQPSEQSQYSNTDEENPDRNRDNPDHR